MSARNEVESIDMLDVELEAVINYHLEHRRRFRDYRATAKEMLIKGDTRQNWQAKFDSWDAGYRHHDQRIRLMRKFLSSNHEVCREVKAEQKRS